MQVVKRVTKQPWEAMHVQNAPGQTLLGFTCSLKMYMIFGTIKFQHLCQIAWLKA
uniref:Uncharacterized protein n=1 Tax=Romanomermis culicivorax TaxID=13658 RepID=A0A915J8V2_ROMCU